MITWAQDDPENTHPQWNLLYGRFSLSIAEEQHALFAADHEARRNRRFVLQHRHPKGTLKNLLVCLLRIHVKHIDPFVELSRVPPNHLAVGAAREKLSSGLAVDPLNRVDAFAVANLAWGAGNGLCASAGVPRAALSIRLTAHENVCVL